MGILTYRDIVVLPDPLEDQKLARPVVEPVHVMRGQRPHFAALAGLQYVLDRKSVV